MIERRACARPARPSLHTPSSSGPRCRSVAIIARSRTSSWLSGAVLRIRTKPATPHICYSIARETESNAVVSRGTPMAAPITRVARRSAVPRPFLSPQTFSDAAERLVQSCASVPVGMPFICQVVSGTGDPPPLDRVSEPRDRLIDVGEIRVERDVVLIGRQNIVISPAQQDLTRPRPRSVEMAGGNAFGIDRTARSTGKKACLDLIETCLAVIKCLMADRRNLQQTSKPGLQPIRQAPAQSMDRPVGPERPGAGPEAEEVSDLKHGAIVLLEIP